jgi:hypothetical protein
MTHRSLIWWQVSGLDRIEDQYGIGWIRKWQSTTGAIQNCCGMTQVNNLCHGESEEHEKMIYLKIQWLQMGSCNECIDVRSMLH